jgi:hypothetical protein
VSDRFVARPAPFRMLLLLALSLGFVVLGFWIAGLLGPVPRPGREWVGWLSIAFFGLCFIFGIGRLFDRDDQIVVDRDGVIWRQRSDARIPWSEIRSVRSFTIRRQHLLSIDLKEPALFPPTTLLGRLGNANRSLGFGDVVISTAGTNRSFRDLRAAIERYAPTGILED